MLVFLTALWITTCGVNGENVPCTATRIIAGPISERQCAREQIEQTEKWGSRANYDCARFEGDGRFQLSPDGSVKIYE